MTLAYLNALLSLAAVLGLIFSALGWRHSLVESPGSPEWFFAMAKVLLAIGLSVRLFLWDVVWGLVRATKDIDAARSFSDSIGNTDVNIVSTIIVLMGVYCSLKARQLILEQDRGIKWHWTIAWAYPRAKTLIRVITRRRYYDGK